MCSESASGPINPGDSPILAFGLFTTRHRKSMQDSSPHTGIQCLTAIAQHHGLHINPERLVADYAVGSKEAGPWVLLRMAADIGLKAKVEHLSWKGLMAQGGVFPLMACMRDGSFMIVVGMRAQDEEKIALLDPTAAQAVVVLEDEVSFCDRWDGQVILLKREH